jgi:hypothetical protein
MKHTVDTSTSARQRRAIANVAANDLNAPLTECGILAAAKTPHAIPAGHQSVDDVPTEKTAAAGDKCMHRESKDWE